MLNSVLIAVIALIFIGLQRIIPAKKIIAYIMLAVSILPLAYFYAVKYYYKDHAANEAGAYIIYATFCAIILIQFIKYEFHKYDFVFDILQYILFAAALCYTFIYGTKVSSVILLYFLLINVVGILPVKPIKKIINNKYVCYIYILLTLLGSIAVRLVTHSAHDGLTYVYTNGGVIPFLILLASLSVWLYKITENINKNKITFLIFSAIMSILTLLWLNPHMIQLPLTVFILVLGYSFKYAASDAYSYQEYQFPKYLQSSYSGKEPLIISLVLSIELAVSLVFLGPLDVFAGNHDELRFSLGDFLLIIIIASIVLTMIVFAILYAIKKVSVKCYTLVTMAVFSIEICMYVQTMFMNIKLYETNGSPMNWAQLSWFTPINNIIWVCLIVVVIRLSEVKNWKNILIYTGSFLIIIQVVAAVSILITADNEAGKVDSVFSNENEFKVAPNDNILVFLVDSAAKDVLHDMEDEYPGLLDNWHDFTEYTNANSDYCNTFPSITSMMTCYKYDNNEWNWRANAWENEKSESFYKKLHDKDYTCNLYSFETLRIGSYEELNGKIDNIKIEKPVIKRDKVCALLFQMSVYRNLPYVLKPYFEIFHSQFDEVAVYNSMCAADNVGFFDQMNESGVTVSNDMDNQLAVFHILGFHRPYSNDENASYAENVTDMQMARGVVHILDTYMDYLKKIDMYDNSTIIITADHSEQASTPQPIFFIKRKNEKHEERLYNDAPISHGDFCATVMETIGDDDGSFGKSIWAFNEGDVRERVYAGEGWNWGRDKYFELYYSGDESALLEEIEKAGIIE